MKNPLKNPFKKLMNWYFSKSALPYWCILLLDFLLLMIGGILTYWIFIYRKRVTFDQSMLLQTLFVYALPSIIGARMFHTYAGIVRYSSFVDLARVFYASLLSLVIAYPLHFMVRSVDEGWFYNLHFRHICLMYLIGTLLMWLMRVLVKTLFEVTTTDLRAQRVLVFGSIDGCIGLAKNFRSQTPRHYVVKGFISDDDDYKHNLVMGEKVYSPADELPEIIEKFKIDAVLVSPQNINDFRERQELQDKLINAGVKILMTQNAKEMSVKGGELQEEIQMKEVSVEDLLPRDEIQVDMKSMGELLSGKRVLITGAAGSIGSELVRQIAAYQPAAMMLIDQAETPEHDIRLMMAREFPDVPAETVVTSICKKERMKKVFSEFRPDYVFHAAAYKHVPMMEDNPSEAVQNNILGTKIIADLADKYGVKKFVMVSTDKAVNPTNVMGCSKRICEIYVQSLSKKSKTQFVTTRFGNVLGSNGSVIPLFQEQIKHGGPVTVTDKRIVRYFMLIPEACKLVLEAGTKGHGGEIFVFDMGKPVRIADLAERMIRLSGAKNVEIKYTGLREGEKLYEEVLNDKENTKPTFHKKIRIAEVREYDFDKVSKDVDKLIALSLEYDDMATVKKMKEIVPEYKSNNSKFEKLDQ
jgi:FlaA1/EpsC-like NDP-sugar epimerase